MSQDPMGFGAGDANLTRYVGNRPTGFRDPAGLDPGGAQAGTLPPEGKPGWQGMANGMVNGGLPVGGPFSIFDIAETIIARRSAAYASMFLRNVYRYRWMGLAVFAVRGVRDGVNDCRRAFGDSKDPDLRRALMDFVKTLQEGNLEIYSSLMWSHFAYEYGGIAEIQRLFDAGDLDPGLYSAWKDIALGETEGILGIVGTAGTNPWGTIFFGLPMGPVIGNQDLIWKGNLAFAYYEQRDVLQKVFDKMSWSTKVMMLFGSRVLKSPLPGKNKGFAEFCKEKGIDNPDFSVFLHRWGYVVYQWDRWETMWSTDLETVIRRIELIMQMGGVTMPPVK